MQSNKESNQKLIERFPFLIPRNRWTGKVPEDYDYSYTELDSMPDGWRKDHAIKLLKRWKAEQEVQERNSANAK